MELQAIAAAVIGGTAITGGRATVAGVVAGALLLGLVSNALVMWQVSVFHYDIVIGSLLLAAVLGDRAWRVRS
jgi:ribose transport system permease protein